MPGHHGARHRGGHMGDEAGTELHEVTELQRSSRDREELAARLGAWLVATLPEGAEPRIHGLEGTSANGMSSETLLFDASWTEDGAPCHHRLVARVAPGAEDVPVFPRYDLPSQFDAIRLVGELTRRAGAVGVVVRARPGRARGAVLRDGPGRRPRAARHHAVQLRRQLALRRRPRRPAPPAGRHGRRPRPPPRRRPAGRAVRLPRPPTHRRHPPAPPRGGSPGTGTSSRPPTGSPRRSSSAASPGSTSTGPTTRARRC